MKAIYLLVLLLSLVLNALAFAQTEERNVEFTVSPGVIQDGTVQVGFKWITPLDFRKKELSLMDSPRINALHPNNNQMIISKIAFIVKKPLASFSFEKMNNAAYISSMLNSVSIRKMTADTWSVTNKVKAYNIPFKVSFELKLKEVTASSLGTQLSNYFKDESAGFKGTGSEKFLILDMTNFSQLMYRNYSVVYAKEVSANETMIVAGIIAGFDINTANNLFNLPPFSTTKGTMMSNLRSQILQMARSLQKN